MGLRRCALLLLCIASLSGAARGEDDFMAEGTRKPANAAELQAIVDAPPPASGLFKELEAHYRAREAAAQQLGLHALVLKNAQEWFDAMPEGDMRYLPRWQLWAHHKNYGDRTLALRLGEEVLAGARGSIDPFLIRLQLAWDYLDQFDVPRARTLTDEGEAALAKAEGQRQNANGQFQVLRGRVELLTLRAALAGFDGKFADAERYALASRQPAQEALAMLPRLDPRRQEIAYGTYLGYVNALRKAHLAQGKTFQAEVLLREAIDFLRRENRLTRRYGSLMRHAAQIRLAQGRFAEARRMADASVRNLTEQSGDVLNAQVVWSRLTRLYATLGTEDWTEALAETRRLEAETANAPALRKLLENLPRGLSKLKGGDAAGAQRLFAAAVRYNRERYGDGHFFTAQAIGLHGAAQLALARSAGRGTGEALALLRQAAGDMAAQRGIVPGTVESGMRAVYRRVILEAYLAALLPAMTAGDAAAIDEGFRIADTLRSASVQQAVVDAALRSAASIPGLGELIRRLQDAQREIAALYDYVARQLGEAPERRNPQVVARMRERLGMLEAEREDLLQRIRAQFPEFDQLSRPTPPEPAAVVRRLGPREALLAVLSAEERSYLWLLTGDGVRFAATETGEAQVGALVQRLRRTLDVAGLDSPPPVDAEAAHALYAGLLQPLRAAIGKRDLLTVAVGGAAASLPFPVLLTRPGAARPEAAPWLIRDMAIAVTPSVAAWMALRQLPPAKGERTALAAFGDPDFGGAATAGGPLTRGTRNLAVGRDGVAGTADGELGVSPLQYQKIPPLPETRDELLAIARTLGADRNRDVFLGSAATKAAVLRLNGERQLSRRQVVMFATHGLIPGDLPGLEQPALALAYGGQGVQDALLTLEDVLGLQLDADWVVLSACNTAAADGKGGEAVSGLGRGFFYAGARALLLTHWAVESESATALTTTAFARYAADPRLSRAEALRQAQLALLRDPRTAHPAYWAPYALFGDGAR